MYFQKQQLDEALAEVGLEGGEGKFDFPIFCAVASKFMIEEDEEQMREELKEAFRIYDKEGNGYITTDVLKEILHEIDPLLTPDDLEGIIEEVDEDGSGTLDFDGERATALKKTKFEMCILSHSFSEFQEMMMG